MSSSAEREYINTVLIPEIQEDFEGWAKEYQQDRDLGERGEFASLYRKVRKLKTILWDGADATLWREGTRTIVKEVVSHGLLLLCDLDRGRLEAKEALKAAEVTGLSTHPPAGASVRQVCGPSCSPRIHTFAGLCRYRLAVSDA